MVESSKLSHLQNLITSQGLITALAIDQRGALKRMLGDDTPKEKLEEFKVLVAKFLTPYASAILLDPEIGIPAISHIHPNCGLILAYEKTGYDKTNPGRFPDLLDHFSALRLYNLKADAVKLLIYYDVDEGSDVNDIKQAFVERVAQECEALQLPLFLEILTYDHQNEDREHFARVKHRKVNEAMRVFSQPQFKVDVLKVEVPVDMNYVEGYAKEGNPIVHTKAQAAQYFKEQAETTHLPYIFLSAGVSAELFQETLIFAQQAGSKFNGVLCGRATWAGAANIYKEGGIAEVEKWLETQGKQNITELNNVISKYATPIK